MPNAVSCLWTSCAESFATEDDCFAHLTAVHAQDGKQQCKWHPHEARPVCGQNLRNRGNFSDHVVTHFSTALRPIVCPRCPVRLRNRKDVKRHESKHLAAQGSEPHTVATATAAASRRTPTGNAAPQTSTSLPSAPPSTQPLPRKRKISSPETHRTSSHHSDSPILSHHNSPFLKQEQPFQPSPLISNLSAGHARSASDSSFHHPDVAAAAAAGHYPPYGNGNMPAAAAAAAAETYYPTHERHTSYPGSAYGHDFSHQHQQVPHAPYAKLASINTSGTFAHQRGGSWGSFHLPPQSHFASSPLEATPRHQPHTPSPLILHQSPMLPVRSSASQHPFSPDQEHQRFDGGADAPPPLRNTKYLGNGGGVGSFPTPITSTPVDMSPYMFPPATPLHSSAENEFPSQSQHSQSHSSQSHSLQSQLQTLPSVGTQNIAYSASHSWTPAGVESLDVELSRVKDSHNRLPFSRTVASQESSSDGTAGQQGWTWHSGSAAGGAGSPSSVVELTTTRSGANSRELAQRVSAESLNVIVRNPPSVGNVGIKTSVIQRQATLRVKSLILGRLISVFFTIKPQALIPGEMLSYISSTEGRGGYVPSLRVHELFINYLTPALSASEAPSLLTGFVNGLPSRSEYSYRIYRGLTAFARAVGSEADASNTVFMRCGRNILSAIRCFCNSEDPYEVEILNEGYGFAAVISQMPLKMEYETVTPLRIGTVLHLRRNVYRAYVEGIARDLEWLGGVGGWKAVTSWVPAADVYGDRPAGSPYAVGRVEIRFVRTGEQSLFSAASAIALLDDSNDTGIERYQHRQLQEHANVDSGASHQQQHQQSHSQPHGDELVLGPVWATPTSKHALFPSPPAAPAPSPPARFNKRRKSSSAQPLFPTSATEEYAMRLIPTALPYSGSAIVEVDEDGDFDDGAEFTGAVRKKHSFADVEDEDQEPPQSASPHVAAGHESIFFDQAADLQSWDDPWERWIANVPYAEGGVDLGAGGLELGFA
ncbi:hypothetical protein HDU87_000426 [Geranomyces variabilis]|uniref:C2H2-type domain-containing protein n=1 Tax=Geranomyces variabilis TaxID=109894 RepID=A0AAD5TP51_9FUNG|nr:hypothetical protein HDU87_000426 [Geranomyces variabilis]